MKFKHFALAFGVVVVALAVLFLRPVPILPEAECHAVEGTVSEVYFNSGNDIVFKLVDNKQRYYINRGTERGVAKEDALACIGKDVTIKYPPYWTPLDPDNTVRHLSKIYVENEVLFDECRDKKN